MSFDSKKLENKLIIALRPVFIGSEVLDDTINVIICSRAFNYLPVFERISLVYEVINDGEDKLFLDRPVIIQAFDEQEMDELIETIFI